MSMIVSSAIQPDYYQMLVEKAEMGILITIESLQGRSGMVDSSENIIISQPNFDAIALAFGKKVQEKVQKPEPLADWEIELLEGQTNPLPYIVKVGGVAEAAFRSELEAKRYLDDQPWLLGEAQEYNYEPTMTAYARKYKINS